MAQIPIDENLAYGAEIALILLAVFSWSVLWCCRNSYWVALNSRIRGKTVGQLNDIDGESRYVLGDKESGWISLRNADYELVEGAVTRGQDFNYHVLSRPFGLVIRTTVAACVESLKRLGFNDLSEAFAAYDSEWIGKEENKKRYDELLAEAKQQGKDEKTIKPVIIEQIKKEGQEALVKLTYFTPFTIPLSIVFSEWSAQVVSSENNKLITKQAVLKTREDNINGGVPISQQWNYVLMALTIIGAIGIVAYLMLQQQAVAQQAAEASKQAAALLNNSGV